MTPDSTPDREKALQEVVGAIGEGAPVDWDTAFSDHPALAAELRALRALERLTETHARVAEEFGGGPAADLAGRTLSHYQVIEKIGEGGMAVVYRAHDRRLGRDVALKVLHPDRLGDEAMRQGLLREARLAGSLNHANIATVHDVGEAEGCLYIAMEFVEGSTLHDLARGRPLATDQAIDYGIQIASALRAAHDAGIVHRDMKSRNVCVNRSGTVKVLDFGIAASTGRAAAVPAPGAEDLDDSLSPGAGTLAYMAPELLRGLPADARSDVWAFGVCLFEMLAGDRPFVGGSALEVERAILHEDPMDLPPAVPRPLRMVVARCLHKEPSRRYQSAGEALAALESLRDRAVPRPPAPRWKWVVAALVALAASLAVWSLWPRPPREPSLAVLPTRNESGSAEHQFLADGLTDEIINTFAGIRRFHVLSRTTSDAIARSPQSAPDVARRYELDYVLETAVARRGDRVRVNARLIDARSDHPIWADSFERPMEQIIDLDNAIVLGVLARLKAPLTREEATRLGVARPVNPEAFQAFVRGRNLAMARRYRPALALFLESARLDSTYACAYAGMADCYTEMLYYREMDPSEALSRAGAAADRALALDSTQADAHLARAFLFGIRWDWERARKELVAAREDAPGNAQVHYRWSLYHGVMNEAGESVREMEHAVALDPASARMAVEQGLAYMNARRLGDAARVFERVIRWDYGGETRRAGAYRARVLALRGHADQAVTELTASAGPEPAPFELEELAYALAAAGRRDEAARALERLRSLGPGVPSPLAISATQLALGARAAALETLQEARDRRDPRLVWLEVDQRFDPVRRDPTYRSVLRAIGLTSDP